jgi:hypothetical protein
MEHDRSYFARRSMQERAAAEDARDPLAQEAHLELAARYEELAEATDELRPGSAGHSTRYVKAWLHW